MRRQILGVLAGAVVVLGVAGLGLGLVAGRDAQAYDYNILAISWMPGWCTVEGDARDDERCATGAGWGWSLHGLWPQHETGGWPEFCPTLARDPSRAQTAAMVDIMGSAGLAWHQWRKHGRCSGLSAEAYFAASRAAFEALDLPASVTATEQPLRIAPEMLEREIAAALPGATPAGVAAICRGNVVREVRICLTKDLEPRACNRDVRSRACGTSRVELLPIR